MVVLFEERGRLDMLVVVVFEERGILDIVGGGDI